MSVLPDLADDDDEGGEGEAEYGGGESDDESVWDGETYFFLVRESFCEKYGVVAISQRDGFVYVYTLGKGEELLSEFLQRVPKEKARDNVKPIK